MCACLVLKYYPESGLDQHQLVNWEMILIHGLKLNLTTPWLLTPPIALGGCIKRMSMAIVSLIAMSRVLIFWQASLKVRDWSQGRLDQSKDKHIDPIDILNLMYVWNKNLYKSNGVLNGTCFLPHISTAHGSPFGRRLSQVDQPKHCIRRSWWFQPIWKMNLPQIGGKITNI